MSSEKKIERTEHLYENECVINAVRWCKTCLWFRRVHQNGQQLSSLNAGYDQFIVHLILNLNKKRAREGVRERETSNSRRNAVFFRFNGQFVVK